MSLGMPGVRGNSGFDLLFNLIMIIVIGGFAFAIGSFVWRTAHNISQPVLTRRGRLVSRRQHTTGGGEVGEVHDSVRTWYYLTFQFEDGSREEFPVSGSEYAMLAEGDVGLLQSQGSWFKRFERELPPVAHG